MPCYTHRHCVHEKTTAMSFSLYAWIRSVHGLYLDNSMLAIPLAMPIDHSLYAILTF